MWQIQHCSPLRSKCGSDPVQLALRSMAMSTWRMPLRPAYHSSTAVLEGSLLCVLLYNGTQRMPLSPSACRLDGLDGKCSAGGVGDEAGIKCDSVFFAEGIKQTFAQLRAAESKWLQPWHSKEFQFRVLHPSGLTAKAFFPHWTYRVIVFYSSIYFPRIRICFKISLYFFFFLSVLSSAE